ncbi:MAG: glycosyltransferase involved in cell wall biosynthesis [Pseudohongiellaceae bacterium]|jgi:glycosyltransferase involved in cell wall biosynthesis
MSPEAAQRTCALIPTYENPDTVRDVVLAVAEHLPTIVLVDDGSSAAGRDVCAALADEGLVTLVRLERNEGKGTAVMSGMALAHELGFTHAFQIDGDGQHDIAAIPSFLIASRERPGDLVLGYPVYDHTVPRARRLGRRLTNFWVAVELGSKTKVTDGMIGFRIYPVLASLASRTRAQRMDFDVDIMVRMVRMGLGVVNLPVAVRYLAADEGGVSHFRPFMDNLRLCVMHTRLCVSGMVSWLSRRLLGGNP